MKLRLLLTVFSLGAFAAFGQITLTPSTAELDGDPSVIQEIHIDFHNASGAKQTMTWLRTMNDIPDEWTTSVCDFNLCWAPTADEPGYYFDAPIDTTGTVYVKFDARNYHDGAFNPVPGCGTVEVHFFSVLDSADNNAVALFHARLGVSEEECGVDVVSSVLDNSFAIYPNPAVNNINVIASFNANIAKVDIVNIVGRTVSTYDWNTGSGKMSFDISDLPQGVYFARLIDEAGKVVYAEKVSVLK